MEKKSIFLIAQDGLEIDKVAVKTELTLDMLSHLLYEKFASFGKDERAHHFLDRIVEEKGFSFEELRDEVFVNDYTFYFVKKEKTWYVSEAIIKGDMIEECVFSSFVELKKYVELIKAKSSDFMFATKFFSCQLLKKTLDDKGIHYGEVTSDFTLPILSHSGKILGHIDIPHFSETNLISTTCGRLDNIRDELENAVIEALSIYKNCEHFLAIETKGCYTSDKEVLVPALLPAEDEMCYGYTKFVSGINLFPPMRGECVTLLNSISVDDENFTAPIDEEYDALVASLEDEAPCVSVGCSSPTTWNIVPRYYLGDFNLYYVCSFRFFEKADDVSSLEELYSRNISFASKTSYYFTNTDNALKASEEKAMELIHSYIAGAMEQCYQS